ncbi:MAG: hypothetical protein ACR65T_11700 [Methylocystis sp.]|uniref:hypothetical protein n=1 Tax=Methylocystis sp. TaxID=1911079 RepID=UPI003DA1D403
MADFPINPLYIDILVIQEAALLGVSVRACRGHPRDEAEDVFMDGRDKPGLDCGRKSNGIAGGGACR